MKYFFLLHAFLFCALLSGQSSGKIVFEEKFDLHRNLPPERKDMKDMIPQYNSTFSELVFLDDLSIYQPQKEAEQTEVTANTGGAQMTMRFGRDNRIVYKNLAEDKMVDSREFMQKQFLIVGPPTARKWKIGTGQKDILGYGCMEANYQIDSANSIQAWFTPQIPTSNGPADHQGLPGMILQVDLNNGERTVTATEISLKEVDTTVIMPPSKGKEVTSEEFEKIREEKMKEMHLQQASGHQMMIRRN